MENREDYILHHAYSVSYHGIRLAVVNTLKSSYWYWRREGNQRPEEKKEREGKT
jgi:hypothetical protein